MIAWTFIIGPIVGGIIGGFTNKVAIKMLFRPHTAKYIGRVHIPLTPGIIPKEKGRIARAIGDVMHLQKSVGTHTEPATDAEQICRGSWVQ